MTDKISFNETTDVNNKIQIILRQTDYSEDEAREKLKANNFDHILVIKSFLGITEKKAPPIKSINQEIYKQLRQKLNTSIVSTDLQNNIKRDN
jgi:hypothetical protein